MADYHHGVLEDPKGPWRLISCSNCGFVSTFPIPTAETLRDAYPDDYYSFTDSPVGSLPLDTRVRRYVFRGYYDAASGFAQRVAGRLLHSAVNAVRPTIPLSLLDVGSGSGKDVALYAWCGWDAVGLEKDPRAAQLGQSKGLSIFAGSINDDPLPLPERRFGAILMSHSLEHFLDPVLALQRARELLVDGGRLLVMVPNINSVDFRLFKSAWFHLSTPIHVSHFSKRSLLGLISREGFRVDGVSGQAFLYGCTRESLRGLRADLRRRRVGRLGRIRTIARTIVGFAILKAAAFLAYHLHLSDDPRHLWALKVSAHRIPSDTSTGTERAVRGS